MALTKVDGLYIFELIIYLVLLPVALYLGWIHGKRSILGYFYLNIVCAVRIAADIVSLLPANRNTSQPTIAAAVLLSIGISPLMLALAGMIHGAHVFLINATHLQMQAKRAERWFAHVQLQIHAVSITGMVLVIIGTINLISTTKPPTPADIDKDNKLRSAGAVLILVLWVFMVQYTLYLVYMTHQIKALVFEDKSIKRFLGWLLIAFIFVGVRCAYSVAYIFDHKDSELNPITGALWVKVIFVVLAPMGAVIAMCIGGWMDRATMTNPALVRGNTTLDITYERISVVAK